MIYRLATVDDSARLAELFWEQVEEEKPLNGDEKNVFIHDCTEDLLEFARLNINETPKYLQLCHKDYGKGGFGTHNTGLGWFINPTTKSHWHVGNTDGFASAIGITKEKDFALVTLANVSDYEERMPLIDEIVLANWGDTKMKGMLFE